MGAVCRFPQAAGFILMRIGVDTGGTFTDCVVLKGREIKILKVFSASDPSKAVLDGVRQLISERVPPRAVEIIHGTTVGTNSLLERRGARVALITTGGFEDLIEIGRQARPRLYDLNVRREPPLVPRALRWGANERTTADGKILRQPGRAALVRLENEIKRSRAQSVAICFLFSFLNPQNERATARAIREIGIPVSVSHEILPEFREYERLSTTVINAYLSPRLGEYLARLEGAVGEGLYGPPAHGGVAAGLSRQVRNWRPKAAATDAGRIFVMQSSGGITTAAKASREPVRTILSGPAGGVVAAAWLSDLLGLRRAISFDMGGTSTDVCLLDGKPRTTNETIVAGLPVAVSVLDVHSVGAGGGSIARLDAGGALRVGPESAGATPGPICYGRGGTAPTVTDANLLLGRLDADHFLGGTFKLDERRAAEKFAEFLRSPKLASGAGSRTPLDLARGIVAVSNATMERALRVISIERGHDPRDFALICFGGAGGLHAAGLARSLGLARVVVPQNPGAFSALGILISDIVRDVSRSVLLPVLSRDDHSPEARKFFGLLEDSFRRIKRAARAELRRDGLGGQARVERALDVRYIGQSYELRVPFTRDFQARFHADHEKAYGYAQPGRRLEIVNLRVRLTIPTPKPRPKPAVGARRALPSHERGLVPKLLKQKRVWFGERFWMTAFYEREGFEPGARFAGPAVVVEYSSTTVVPPGWVCQVDGFRNLVLSYRRTPDNEL